VLLTAHGGVNITKAENAGKFSPIEAGCGCPTCQTFSLAYLHHLFKARELTAMSLATAHNLYFMVKLMQRYREAILEGRL
jgi:queuine tRNA-ribosyltransferase